jgi:hypothetical protein
MMPPARKFEDEGHWFIALETAAQATLQRI